MTNPKWVGYLLAAALIGLPAPGFSAPKTAPRVAGSVTVEAGSGRVIELGGAAASLFVADPKVAEARPASPTSLFIFGLAVGRTTITW